MSKTGPTFSLNLEQFVALNDELEALVRSGLPLEQGLAAAAGDYRGRLGPMMRDLGQRLGAGEQLPEALGHSFRALPAAYRAMVEAGLRSGRLADAFQGLSRTGQAVLETRRTIVLACFYPLLVVVLAYALFLFFVVAIMPRFQQATQSLRLDDSRFVAVLERLGPSITSWGPIFPTILLGLILAWLWSGRSRSLDGGAGVGSMAGRVPWLGQIVVNSRTANFVDVLADLVDHDLPLDEAVRLAGNAAGGSGLRQSARQLAAGLAAGGTPSVAAGSIPPLVCWMLAAGDRQGSLAPGLRHLATTYRRKAARQAEACRIVLPGLMILIIGLVAVLAYGLLLFIPLRHLWDGLANP